MPVNVILPLAPETWPAEGLPWVKDPRRFAPGLDGLLAWSQGQGASRIAFQTGHPVSVRIHGRNRAATVEALDHMAIVEIANHLYGADGAARLENGHDFDVSYAINLTRTQQLRFRVNATPTMTRRRDGANFVLRPIPDASGLNNKDVEPEILAACRPASGMVFVGGATGSGKTTLLAGILRDLLQDPAEQVHIGTGEAPIEFLLDREMTRSGSTINQSEIPRHLPTFEAFIRGCMRRELTHILVGECRDTATMGAAINAAMVGGVLYTTIHADDVPLMMQRATSLCPADERDNLVSALAQALRLVINQRLVPSVDGRRTAIREYLVFDRPLRMKMLRTDATEWPAIISDAVREQGQTFAQAIHKALAAGRITEETAALELRRDA